MERQDLAAWLRGHGDLARRVGPDDLQGFFKPHFNVPQGCLLLCKGERGEWRFVPEGDEVQELKEGILVKQKPFPCHFSIPALKTLEALECTVTASLEFSFGDREFDLKQVRERFLAGRDHVALEDLSLFLESFVERAYASLVSATSVEDLYGMAEEAIFAHLQKELKEGLFEAGLTFRGMHENHFICPEYDQLQEEVVGQKMEEERRAVEHEGFIANKELELTELQKAAEVAEKQQGLKKQVALDQQKLDHLLEEKELRKRFRVQDLKAEDEIRRFKALKKKLGNETKALLFLMEDEDARLEIINSMMEKEMTPEQIQSRAPLEMQRKLDRSLKKFFTRLTRALDDFEAGKAEQKGEEEATRRILVASGARILTYDPKTNIHPERIKEIISLSNGTLGSLRSLRLTNQLGEPNLLAGARRGVYLLPLDRDDFFEEYRFQVEDSTRFGTNSACIVGRTLYATHSGQGLVRWNLKGSLFSELVYRSSMEDTQVTRGVCFPQGESVYFSSGKKLLAFSPEDPGRFTFFHGAHSAITAFASMGTKIYAGTEAGRILVWDACDPVSPRELPVRKDKGITMVRISFINGRTRLLIAGRDRQILALDPESMEMIAYSTPGPVRWADGASDFIVGVDSGGHRAYVFRTKDPTIPPFSIYTEDRIQDICIRKSGTRQRQKPSP